jgi:hypothetical protein
MRHRLFCLLLVVGCVIMIVPALIYTAPYP